MRRAGLLLVLAAAFGLGGSAGGGISVPPPPGDMYPTWSPDASVIVFLSEREGPSLRVMNTDGTNEHRLPWLPANATYVFSPDWSHIAAFENGQIVVERLDGTDRLALGPATYATTPSWSPEGTRVTFTAPSSKPNQADVVVARIDGSDTRRVALGVQPTWAPAGQRIAYLAGTYDENELHLVNADGSGDVRLTSGGGFSQPRWAPDATRLAIVHRKTGRYRTTLKILGVDGAQIAAFRVTLSEYDWSTRGNEIAYAAGNGIWLLDVGSKRRRQVAAFGGQLAWSPNGSQLAFSSGGECRNRNGIYRVDAARARPARLTNDCRIAGTPGDDVITGTRLADVLLGRGGNDTLRAVPDVFTGDTLEGGPGEDLLRGSFRGDTLEGGPGADVVRGGPSADLIVGGPGRDVLEGQGGRDAIYARDGRRDLVSCGTNASRTTGPEGDVAYVDRRDRILASCEYVYRAGGAPPLRGRTSLVITVWPQGSLSSKNPHRDFTLRCRPPGGTLPRGRTACAKLARVQNPFAPGSPAEPCALIYQGDEAATVRGVFGGREVRAGFDRLSTCSVRRWDRVAFLFPTVRS